MYKKIHTYEKYTYKKIYTRINIHTYEIYTYKKYARIKNIHV